MLYALLRGNAQRLFHGIPLVKIKDLTGIFQTQNVDTRYKSAKRAFHILQNETISRRDKAGHSVYNLAVVSVYVGDPSIRVHLMKICIVLQHSKITTAVLIEEDTP